MPAAKKIEYIHPKLRALAMPVSELTLDPKNARKHGARNIEAIRASLEEFGFRIPLVAQRRGEEVIVRAGNGRVMAMQHLGWEYAPVLVFEEDDDDAVGYAIADNRTADLAEWDVQNLIDQLDAYDLDVEALGWSMDELESMMPPVAAPPAPDTWEAPKGSGDDFRPPAPETVRFTFGKITGLVRPEVYAKFKAALDAHRTSTGDVMLDDLLELWLADVTAGGEGEDGGGDDG